MFYSLQIKIMYLYIVHTLAEMWRNLLFIRRFGSKLLTVLKYYTIHGILFESRSRLCFPRNEYMRERK